MAAPVGNHNAAKAKQWAAAIERAIARKAGHIDQSGIEPTPFMKGLDALADKFVAGADAGELPFLRELGDRIDGKPRQQVELSGDSENPLQVNQVVRTIVDPREA